MKKIALISLAASITISLSACMSKPQNIMNMSQKEIAIDASLFTKGKTISSEVKSKLGKPMIENIKGDGMSLYMYSTICSKGYNECMTNFVFNNGVLTDINTSNR